MEEPDDLIAAAAERGLHQLHLQRAERSMIRQRGIALLTEGTGDDRPVIAEKALRLESEERLVFGDNTGRIGKVAEKERGAAVEHRAGFTAELAEGVFDQLKLIANGNGTETEQKAIAENRLLIEERFGIEVAAEGLLQAQTGGGRLTRLLKTEPCDDKARTGDAGSILQQQIACLPDLTGGEIAGNCGGERFFYGAEGAAQQLRRDGRGEKPDLIGETKGILFVADDDNLAEIVFFGKRVDDDLDVHPAGDANENQNVGVDALERRLTGADILLKDNAEALFRPVEHSLQLHTFHVALSRDQNLALRCIVHVAASCHVFDYHSIISARFVLGKSTEKQNSFYEKENLFL